MPHSCSNPSPSNDRPKKSEGTRNSSITPQRKHRKLLKDGSGSEVWPEAVEKIFVEGLRHYWESPWASYSRGRSRWRNQFLVDYLRKAGIGRSKKQVASHMQVLRNMWKGEPEFHLVAGGEELYPEPGILSTVKTEEPCESGALVPINGEEGDFVPQLSPSPPTSGYSSADYNLESPSHSPSHSCSAIFDTFTANPFPIDSPHARSPSSSQHDDRNVVLAQSPVTRGSPPSTFSFEHGSIQQTSSNVPSSLYGIDYQAHPFPPLIVSASPESANAVLRAAKLKISTSPSRELSQASLSARHTTLPSPTSFTISKLSSLCLWAEGFQPYHLSVDSLRTSSLLPLSPVYLHIRLSLPSVDVIHSLPAVHGFHGTVNFKARWTANAKCITKVYAGKACVSEENENLQLVASSTDCYQLSGFLPSESSLSRCRWLDPILHFSITQEFILDGELLALIVYELDRKTSKPPTAQLTSFSGDEVAADNVAVVRTPTTPTPLHYHYPTSYNLSPQTHLSRFWRMDQALSCGLPPINGMAPVMATPMLF